MENHLSHHGIIGQKWGVRRFQNSDGTRTEAGKKRYSDASDDIDQLNNMFYNNIQNQLDSLMQTSLSELNSSDSREAIDSAESYLKKYSWYNI